MNYKIAIINNKKPDGLLRTVLDGLIEYKKETKNLDFRLSNIFNYDLPLNDLALAKSDFIDYARGADLIILSWENNESDIKIMKKIKAWNKTVYLDGSEPGRNRRYDFKEQYRIIKGKKNTGGEINWKMLDKCALYFRREKPYIKSIVQFPFGIESVYYRDFDINLKKDIDFFCVFGQDEFPLMRRYAVKILKKYCKKNGFTCHTKKVPREKFYNLMNRSKVSVSIGGGGYDSMRFWESLANNCLLLTETIDIYQKDSRRLDYNRIKEFNNLHDFVYQLEKLGNHLKTKYKQEDLIEEYKMILDSHSSIARVKEIIKIAKDKNIIN